MEASTVALGASKVAAALGLSPWTSPYELWARKMGRLTTEKESNALDAGTRLEPAILDWAESGIGLIERPVEAAIDGTPIVTHPDGVPALLGGLGFTMFRVPSSPEIQREIVERACTWFRDHVEADRPPELTVPPPLNVLTKLRRDPWRTVELDRGFLILPAESAKTKQEQVFRLPDYAISKIMVVEWPRRELIWEWPHGRRWLFRYFRKHILSPAQLEPLPGEHFGLFHKVRRTSASLAAAIGGVQAAQTLLGHSSARMTLEHYIDPIIAGSSAIELPSLE